MARWTINVGVLKVELDEVDLQGVRRLRRVLFGGPCLIQCRHGGRALDAGSSAGDGTRPVVWDTHALPWQQWLIQPEGKDGAARIISVPSALALTATVGGEWSPVVLQRSRAADRAQLWHLELADDKAAFLVQNVATRKALDAGEQPTNGVNPGTWEPHWAAWQQWVIARLPLAPAKPN